MVAGPQERAIQTVRPALLRATAGKEMTAEGRVGVHLGLRAMTVLSVTTVQVVTTGRAVMIGQAGTTAVAVMTVRTGKAGRIGRVSQTVQTVQIGLNARTDPIVKTAKTATTVRTDRAVRTERAVEALLTTALATDGMAAIVLANLLPRVATSPRDAGISINDPVCCIQGLLAVNFRGAFAPLSCVRPAMAAPSAEKFRFGVLIGDA